jgi:hypothetical protein
MSSIIFKFLLVVLWIQIGIRIRSDPKLLAGSGSEKNNSGSGELWIRNDFRRKTTTLKN